MRIANGSADRSGSSTHAVKVGSPIDSAKYTSSTRRRREVTSVPASHPSKSDPSQRALPTLCSRASSRPLAPAPRRFWRSRASMSPPPHHASRRASRAPLMAGSRQGASGSSKTCSPRHKSRERGTQRRGASAPARISGVLRTPIWRQCSGALWKLVPPLLKALSSPRAALSWPSIPSSPNTPFASVPNAKTGVASQSSGSGKHERAETGRNAESRSPRPSMRA
mmetsp:Transcript_10268/g.29873  ORF Transcript_10268/g.29873 Transcript_10268/m.29873 type:complete len:224 (-) Transcript_10268:143-814(-)